MRLGDLTVTPTLSIIAWPFQAQLFAPACPQRPRITGQGNAIRMILQSTDSLEEYIGNKYSLVIVAAKRARQLKEGHTPLVADPSTENFLSHALKEIEDHRVQSVAPPEEELAPAPRDVIASLAAGAEF